MTSIRPNVSGREQNQVASNSVVEATVPCQKSTLCKIYYETFSKFICPVLHTTKSGY